MAVAVAAILAAAGVLCFARTASAHEWESDGSITVLMHANPNDNPVAGEPAALLFSVNDPTGRFAAGDCRCSVTVSGGGRTLVDGPLQPFHGDALLYNFSIPLTFPEAGVYHIVVTGSPEASSTFQSFRVAYDERVGPGPYDLSSADIAAIATAVLMAAVAFYFIYREVRS